MLEEISSQELNFSSAIAQEMIAIFPDKRQQSKPRDVRYIEMPTWHTLVSTAEFKFLLKIWGRGGELRNLSEKFTRA
jgi:hypothetical protein